MKIQRYQDTDDAVKYGLLQDDGSLLEAQGDPWSGLTSTGRAARMRELLVPFTPSMLFGIGLNYREHAAESKMAAPERPVLFMKGLNSITASGQPILLPRYLASEKVDYECELAVVIGKPCKNVTRAQALDYVLGYTCANDVSARDWQIEKGGGQWCRGKTFDTFCPLGPTLVTADEIPNPNALRIKTLINDEVRQDLTTGDMIFDVPALIEFLSGSTTLLPGTVILTGTPQGVGMASNPPRWLQAGDVVVVEIEEIGRLVNPVQAETF